MYVPLAPGREIVFGEGLFKVIPPSRQVRVCVCLNILIDICSRREILRVTADVDRALRLIDTNPVYPHGSWENKVREVNRLEVLRDAQVGDKVHWLLGNWSV